MATRGKYLQFIYHDKPYIETISPMTGSKLGGTLITITGGSLFDTYKVMVGDYLCTVVSYSTTEVKCRVENIAEDTEDQFHFPVPIILYNGLDDMEQ